MRIALPLFGTDLSPRFCFAAQVLIVTQDGRSGVETQPREQLSLEGLGWPDRLERLVARHVDVLLCGGFPRIFLERARGQGIHVEVGLGGDAERVLDAFRRNALVEVTIGGRRCRYRHGFRREAARPGGR